METLQINFSSKKQASNKNITDRIKTFEDACDVLGIKPDNPVSISYPNEYASDVKSVNAYVKLIIIVRALNEGWTPDWAVSSQYKYLPWFQHKSGFGLSCDDYGGWNSGTIVGSRLCYKSKELAIYAATQFADIYRDYLTL